MTLQFLIITADFSDMVRIKNIINDLSKEIETVRLENEIEDNLKIKLEEDQREYMLKEKIRLIKEELGVSYEEEFDRVVIHGILHLCGINDKGPGEREIMEAAENAALEIR